MARHRVTSKQEIRGAVELAASGFDRITARIHEFHRAVSDIPFDRLEPLPGVAVGSRPTRTLHDGITDGVYTAVRLGGRALLGAAAVALRAAEAFGEGEARRPSRTIDDLESAINGLFGDALAAQRNPLAVRLGFYAGGRRLRLTTEALAAAQPRATPRLVLFIHGLACNENAWSMYADPEDPATRPYAERLAELGFTAYFARYNTGLHVSQNGRLLAREIGRLVSAHPVPVREIVVIGHSMGGLVSRAACHSALRRNAEWTALVSNVICLGSPHLGAPLEQAVHLGASVLDAFPLTRPLATFLNDRSLGIQDLRHGYTTDADWRGRNPRSGYAPARAPLERLPRARYHFIGSSIGASEDDRVGQVIGDGLVRLPSSTARELADADTAVLYKAHHLRLLNHPEVYEQIRSRVES